MAGLWRNETGTREGKYLVKRRDGTIPAWAWFVLGERDPAAPAALRAYANEAERLGMDPKFVADIRAMSLEWDAAQAGGLTPLGNPDAGRHRVDDPATIAEMSIVGTGAALVDLAADHARWSQSTFGSDEERGPLGPLDHLKKEAEEAKVAWIMNHDIGGDRGIVAEEFADCFLLVLDAARRAGIKSLDLIRAAGEKLEVNKARQWSKPQPDSPVEHVRDAAPIDEHRDPYHACG